MTEHPEIDETERLRRWRLLVGDENPDDHGSSVSLSADDRRIDAALAAATARATVAGRGR